MKQCPVCQKEYEDNKRFCQNDGTPLVDKVENLPVSDDQFKTVVGNQTVVNDDPYKTVVASDLLGKEEDLLQIPDDPLKTMVVSKSDLVEETPKPSEPSIPIPTDVPIFNEPSLTPPNLSELSVKPPKIEEPKPPVVETEAPTMMAPPMEELPDFNSAPLPSESPFSKSDAAPPIPSPFEPTTPKFDLPTFKEEEKTFPPPLANPFDQPFGNQQIEQQSAWTPPPAPESSWQQESIGQNTPFQPPAKGVQGQNQTLAIVSLVTGILSIVCCQLTGPVAVITGYMARKKAEENPQEYTGSGLALAGLITGAIGTILLVLVIIYYIVVIGLVASGNIR